MSATGSCPACGSPLVFRVATSVVTVCTFCKSVVARGDAKVEDLGKTNDILATGSALALGVKGKLRASAFEIVGHTQLRHSAGGAWDEWYVAFDNEKWGFLAEHQGRFALTLEADAAAAPRFRSLADAKPGARVNTAKGSWVVAERGVASVVAEEGELPWRAAPGQKRAYLDLSGGGGAFATLDLGDVNDAGTPQGPVRWFVGREVSFNDLGLGANAAVAEAKLRKVVDNQQVRCPKCGAQLELRSGAAESVACSSCGAVSSVSENNELAFLWAQTARRPPLIPLGKKGRIDKQLLQFAGAEDLELVGEQGLEVEVVAFMVRSVSFDGMRYFFSETLLHNDKQGFFWLVESDGHWSFVRNVPAGNIATFARGESVRFDGVMFRPYQESRPRVEEVSGELYWRVRKGEESGMLDLIRPPLMLSRERTENEINWTLGIYVDKRDVERVFAVRLENPVGPGANQPSPLRDVLKKGPLVILAAVVVCAVVAAVIPSRTVLNETVDLPALAAGSPIDPGRSVSFAPLRLHSAQNVVVTVRFSDAGWLWTDGNLFHTKSGVLTPFSIVAVADAGNHGDDARLSALPAGDYALNLKLVRNQFTTARTAQIVVRQGLPGSGWATGLVLLAMLGYLIALISHASFENKRKESSTFQ